MLGLTYTIINQVGQKVLSGKLISQTTVVDINQLATGIYLFQIGEFNKQKFKVIKK